jgi:uncharacterized protein (DUF2164 family)
MLCERVHEGSRLIVTDFHPFNLLAGMRTSFLSGYNRAGIIKRTVSGKIRNGDRQMKRSPLDLNPDKRKLVLEKIKAYVSEDMDQDIGDLKAELFLYFIKDTCGKEYYNKGISDAKKYLFGKMEDLEIDMDQIFLR